MNEFLILHFKWLESYLAKGDLYDRELTDFFHENKNENEVIVIKMTVGNIECVFGCYACNDYVDYYHNFKKQSS